MKTIITKEKLIQSRQYAQHVRLYSDLLQAFKGNLITIWVLKRERERHFCLKSTEASMPVRDGDEWENGERRVKPRNRR